jgi:cyclophilin family peptidyl-prolyl cis-trans isomerase
MSGNDKSESDRRRSRPVTKTSATTKLKRNKTAMFLVVVVILVVVFSSIYVIYTNLPKSATSKSSSYQDDPEYIAAIAGTDYPVAVLNTSKGIIAVELYNDKMPITCSNFIKLANDAFYDGMIFHRVLDNFMIQAGKSFPDGSSKTSPYGNIQFEESDVKHVDGAISMASTGAGVGGSAEFFICDGAQSGLDGSYAAFGETIYGIDVVRDIADEPRDSSYGSAGGGKPNTDIIINHIIIVNQ